MKCVELRNGLIRKLRDWKARELVWNEKAKFVPKHVFKHEHGVRDAKTGKIVNWVCTETYCTICRGSADNM